MSTGNPFDEELLEEKLTRILLASSSSGVTVSKSGTVETI